MEVKAIYRINERYVIGDDRFIYRLPFVSNGKNYKLRKIVRHRGGYNIDGEWLEKKQIEYTPIDEPFILIEQCVIR